jgi:hypothetical protein
METEAEEVRSICLTPPLRIDEVRDTGLLATTMSLLGLWCEPLGHSIVVGKSVERQS